MGKNLADKGNQTAAIRYYREAVRYCKLLVSLIPMSCFNCRGFKKDPNSKIPLPVPDGLVKTTER